MRTKKPAQWRAQFATRSGAGRPQISRSYRSVQAVQAVQVDACEGYGVMQEGQTQKSPHVRAKSSQLGDQQLDCVIVDQFRKRSRKGRYKKPGAGPGSGLGGKCLDQVG